MTRRRGGGVALVRYKVGPRHDGYFYVSGFDLPEAIELARGMIEHGVENVAILDERGTVLDLAELERLTIATEDA
jgi:hypothetical protein